MVFEVKKTKHFDSQYERAFTWSLFHVSRGNKPRIRSDLPLVCIRLRLPGLKSQSQHSHFLKTSHAVQDKLQSPGKGRKATNRNSKQHPHSGTLKRSPGVKGEEKGVVSVPLPLQPRPFVHSVCLCACVNQAESET